jgi:hypothetical protein
MRLAFIFTIFIFASINSRARQIDPLTMEPADYRYDPVNRTVKDNHIHYVIDSSAFILTGNKCRTWVYDTSGRLAGELTQPGGALKYTVVYKTSDDTTWRMKYDTGKTVLYSYQRFVQNKKGQIISYLDCGNYYLREDSYYAGYEVFSYDDGGRLQSRSTYTREEYPGKVSLAAIIQPAALHLDDAINYTYSSLKNGNKLVIGQHTTGNPDRRSTDSAIYDKQNRVIRFNSFAKTGIIGEVAGNNVNNISLYQYEAAAVQITRYTTYCYVPEGHKDCSTNTETEKQIVLIVYNPNKTLNAKYGYNSSGQRYLADQFVYTTY